MTDSNGARIVLTYLASEESIGSYSENYGNSHHCLQDKSHDQKRSITGDFKVAATEFTRDPFNGYGETWRYERTFKPGLTITFGKSVECVPDITFEQYVDAIAGATVKNGVMKVDLINIQQDNQQSKSFKGRKLKQSEHPGVTP